MVSKTAIVPRLVIIEGKDKGKVITLSDGTAVIGRSKGDVLIQDPRISRSHVAVHFDSRTGKLTFTDLKSLNGTMVNSQTVETGELNDGDKLQIGNTLFDCQISIAKEEPTSTSEILARSQDRQRRADIAKAARQPSPARIIENPREAVLIPLDSDKGMGKEPGAPASSGAGAAAAVITADVTPESQKRTKLQLPIPTVGGLASAYKKIPAKVRTLTLTLIVIMLGLKFVTLPKNLNVKGLTSIGIPSIEAEAGAIRELVQAERYEDALAKAEALKARYPEHSEPYMLVAEIQFGRAQNNLAIENFQKAHSLQPEQPLVHIRLIRAYLRGGQPREAGQELQHVEEVIQSGNFSKELFVETAYLFLEFKELKQPPEKTLILAKALQKEYAPDSSIGYKLEAQLHFQENRPAEALIAMEKGRVIAPQDEWLIENSVFAKLAMKDYTGAETLLEDWLKLRPTATKALLVLAYLRYNEKSYAQALPYVQKILQIANGTQSDPYYPEALNLMGQIYQELQQPTEAANFFRQGCQAGFQQSCEHPLVKNEPVPNAIGAPSPASLPGTNEAAPPAPGAVPPPAKRVEPVAPATQPPAQAMPPAYQQIAPAPPEPDPGQ